MPKLPIVSGKECVNCLAKLGYTMVRQRGSHVRLSCIKRKPVTVPMHKIIATGLLRKILRDAQLSAEDFITLLK
ncbi:MAG TPA: hypothetical protein DCZ84_01830 [Candidatus Vogelbacteria bacterium]|nr:hypothetical protein [Candidatus Vogelbacteria bacterium]